MTQIQQIIEIEKVFISFYKLAIHISMLYFKISFFLNIILYKSIKRVTNFFY